MGHRDVDVAARDELIELHLPFVRIQLPQSCMRTARFVEIEFDEFHHFGVIGMLESIDRFEPVRGVPFRAFAGLRIEGAILNGIESHNERQEQISLKARLRKQRVASLKDSVSGDDTPTSTFAKLAGIAVGMALGYMLEDSGMYSDAEQESTDPAYSSIELKQLKIAVRELVEKLPDQQRRVIKSHYFWGLGVEEIGVTLGLTKGRISQIHRQALSTLLREYQRRHHLDVVL